LIGIPYLCRNQIWDLYFNKEEHSFGLKDYAITTHIYTPFD